jgi:phage I-like protein
MLTELPKTLCLIPTGSFSARDGKSGSWINDRPDVLLEKTRALAAGLGGQLIIDYDHATDLAASKGSPAPAAGWLNNFRLEEGALCANVKWTAAGARAVASGEWAYLSPVFDFTKKGRVVCFIRAGLTNNPALFDTAIASALGRNRATATGSALSPEAKRICAAFMMTEEEFATGKAELKRRGGIGSARWR